MTDHSELMKMIRCGQTKRPIPRNQILRSTHTSQKPPKLRFKPGSFVKENGTGQLYCIRVAYRFSDNPNEWVFALEYRNTVEPPTEFMAKICEALSSAPVDGCYALWEPLKPGMFYTEHELCRNMYHYGDSKSVSNRDLIQNYTLVSSGEIKKA